MKLLRLLLSIFPFVIFFDRPSQAQPIPFTDPRWQFRDQSHMIEGYKGKNALYLQNGRAWLKDAAFTNGIIEFDIFLFPRVSFSGFLFRMTDPNNYEELYLRSQQSGFPDAFQYTPVYNGDAAWQLYHDQFDGVNDGFVSWKPHGILNGYNSVANYPFDRWLHVKMVVSGSQAELYLDNKDEAVDFIPLLKMGEHAGGLGIESSIGATYFADFSYTPMESVALKTKRTEPAYIPDAAVISSWMVSTPFKESDLKGKNILASKYTDQFSWKKLDAEKGDFINIAKLYPVTDSNTVFAKLTIHADKDELRKLELGYSDRIKLYCNGNALYSGNASFRTRDFRHLGTIGFFDAVYLPLKKGDNTILVAVSETFGGWGLMGRMGDLGTGY